MFAKTIIPCLAGLLGLGVQAFLAEENTHAFVPGAYIVEFADGHNDESALFEQLRDEGFAVTKRISFDYHIFKGVSFQLTEYAEAEAEGTPPLGLESQISQASSLVKNVWPIEIFTQPELPRADSGTTSNLEARAASRLKRRQSSEDGPVGGTTDYPPHAMTQVDKMHAEGITGKGIKIAIIDSGVDYRHPALGGCFGEGCLVSFGYDLIGDNFDATNIPEPDDDPFAQGNPHGTHVAGIIAAQENPMGFLGAAYGAQIGSYRVTSCDGLLTTETILGGFCRAHVDEADIITVSIRYFGGWHSHPVAVMAQRIAESGTVFVAGSGNDAQSYHSMFSIGSPGNALGVTGVGAVASLRNPVNVEIGSYAWSDGSNDTFVYQSGFPAFQESFTRPVWLVTPERSAEGDEWAVCLPLPDDTPDLSEYVVVAESCGDPELSSIYLAEKGAQVVLYYSVEPDFMQVAPYCGQDVKGCGIFPRAQGVSWREQIQAGDELELTMTEYDTVDRTWRYFENLPRGGGSVDTYSSWGPTYELDAKVEVLGVGGLVLSTYPTTMGSYDVSSGTSMATPQIAAIYALLMESTGTKDVAKLRSLLQSTASQVQWSGGRAEALAPVPQQGAGLAQAYEASRAPVFIIPSSISFNDSGAFVKSASFRIENRGTRDVTYSIGHSPALTVYTIKAGQTAPGKPPLDLAPAAHATLEFSSESVTVPAGGKAELKVNPTAPTGLNDKQLPVYSGYITLISTSGPESNLVIPYLGVAASMKSDPTYLVPENIHLYDYNTGTIQPANTTFQSPGNLPAVYYTTEVGTPLLRLDIVPMFETADEVPVTVVDGFEIAGSNFTYEWSPWWDQWGGSWNGTVREPEGTGSKQLPAGSYAFMVRTLRIRGNREDKDDWVVVKTDPFRLEYA